MASIVSTASAHVGCSTMAPTNVAPMKVPPPSTPSTTSSSIDSMGTATTTTTETVAMTTEEHKYCTDSGVVETNTTTTTMTTKSTLRTTRTKTVLDRNVSNASSVSSSTTVTFDWNQWKLCGRDDDIEVLNSFYDDRDQIDLVVIGGRQGCGKTALSDTLSDRVQRDGGCLIRGRWPPVSDPHEAFGEAFSDLVHQMTVRDSNSVIIQDISSALMNNCDNQSGEGFSSANSLWLPDRLHVLRTLINGSVGEAGRGEDYQFSHHQLDHSTTIDDSRRECRPFRLDRTDLFHSTVYRILNAVGSVMPVVIVLDNLQSADRASLDLLTFLCQSPSLKNILFVTTCRGQKVERDQFLTAKMPMADTNKACIKEIDLQPLSLNDAHKLVCQLQPKNSPLSEEDCFRLAENVHKISCGSPRLMREALWMIGSKYMDVRALDEPLTYDDVVRDKLQQIPGPSRHILQVLSCLGGRNVHLSVLMDVLHPTTEKQLLDVIFAAKDDGLLNVNKPVEGDFLHYPRLKGRVQEVVYAMMPEDVRQRTHYQIAVRLHSCLSPRELEDRITIIVDQFIQAGSDLVPPNDKSKISELCLLAARHSARSAAFSSALAYVDYGLSLLDERTRWRDHYDLTLATMSLKIEVELITGNHDAVDMVHKDVNANARSHLDTMTANLAKIGSLGSRGNHTEEAVDECLSVLKKLDHKIPSRLKFPRIIAGLMRIRKMLQRTSDEEILTLPRLKDEKIMQVLNTMHILYTYALLQNSELLPLIAMKIIDLTMEYGLSPMSPVSFGIFGMALATVGHNEEAYRCGQLTLKLMDKLHCAELMARCYNAVYGFLKCYKDPISLSIGPLYEAYKLNILTGDVEPAITACSLSISRSFQSGRHIPDFKPQMMAFLETCRVHNQHWVLKLSLLTAQFVANLSDNSRCSNPFDLSGEFLIEEDAIHEIIEDKNDIQLSWFYFLKCMMAAYINDTGSALEAEPWAMKLSKFGGKLLGYYTQQQHAFHSGMIFCFIAKSSHSILFYRRRKLMQQAKRCLTNLDYFARVCPENYLNKARLLEAEIETLKGSLPARDILALYEDSAYLAADQGFTNEEALAWEKAGHHTVSWMANDSMQDIARGYFENARDAYVRWGAMVKVTAIDHILQDLNGTGRPSVMETQRSRTSK